MIKKEFIELIQENLSGGELTEDLLGKYHPELISRYCEVAFNDILWELSRMSHQMKDTTPLDPFTKDFSFTLQKDEIGRDYIAIDKSIGQLTFNQAVRLVYPYVEDGENNPYIYRSPAAHGIYSNSQVETVNQTPRWSIQNNRIIFKCMTNPAPSKVAVKLVSVWQNFEDNDEINIPAGQGSQFMERVKQVIREQKVTPEDVTNNNKADG